MKLLAIVLLIMLSGVPQWHTDFDEAKTAAKQKHQLILLNFSGSDWCGPCMRLRKEVFDSGTFAAVANDQLVLVNADFPRLKKNQLPKNQQQQNEKLADRYNAAGNFPLTVLLNADGKVLKTWEGFPRQGMEVFITELNSAIHDNR